MLPQSNTPDIDPSSRNISEKKPRRPHTKTRTGCRICRQRKVKCDETLPTCKNCQRRGLGAECEYAYSQAAHRTIPMAMGSWIQPQGHGQPRGPALEDVSNVPLPATATTGPVRAYAAGIVGGVSLPPAARAPDWSIPPGSSIPPNLHSATMAPTEASTLMDAGSILTLIHLFTTLTAHSCSTQLAIHRVFSVQIPRQALRLARNHPVEMSYLLHSLLALSALHAATLASHTRRRGQGKDRLAIKRAWMAVAGRYHELTLQGFRVAIQKYAAGVQGAGGAGRGEEMLATLTWEDIMRSTNSGGEGEGSETAPALAKCIPALENRGGEEKQGRAWQNEEAGRPGAVGRHKHVVRSKVAEIFSRLDKDRIDEIEAILNVSSLLMIYGLARDNLDSEFPQPTAPPQTATATTPATTCTTDTISVATCIPLRRPMLSWVPLMRGAPTMASQSPLAWVVLSQGHLAPVLADHFKGKVPDHPYESKLAHLHHMLFTQAYVPHPQLPQTLYPMTSDTLEKAMNWLKHCFAKFFRGADFLGAAMTFPATVMEEFYMGLGLGDERGEESGHARCDGGDGVHGTMIPGGHEGRKDPRALVIMAYALVLFVLVVELFPERSGEVRVGENVCGVLGMDLDHDGGSDSGGDGDDGECRPPPPNHPANALSPTWWIAGVGEREITEIARYLDALDKEEWWADRIEVPIVQGRWMKLMEWPLEIIKNGGKDVVGMLKERVQQASGK